MSFACTSCFTIHSFKKKAEQIKSENYFHLFSCFLIKNQVKLYIFITNPQIIVYVKLSVVTCMKSDMEPDLHRVIQEELK